MFHLFKDHCYVTIYHYQNFYSIDSVAGFLEPNLTHWMLSKISTKAY